MTSFFNILITSISKKIPLIKTVRQAAENLNLACTLYGSDANPICVGRYFVDEFWNMPLLKDLNIEEVVEFCQKNRIKAIIPTRDGELSYFSKHKEYLLSQGIYCFLSKPKTIETCLNKLLFYQFLALSGIPVIPTEKEIKEVFGSSYVVKECFGAGSKTLGLNLNRVQAESWAEQLENPIFQPFIEGEEYSIDVYISSDRSLKGAIVRKRELVVDGESQITYSLQHKEMEELCLKAAEALDLSGHAVFQVLCDASQRLHVIECNPRFGGASTLSVAMGLRSFEWFIQECLEQPLSPFVRSSNEMQMVRYPEDKIFVI